MTAFSLYSVASVEEQWWAVAGPWLRGQATEARKATKPTVVLTPNRAEGFYLRSRLVAGRVPFLGLRFWTPSDVRKFLLGEYVPELGAATQAELRLLARVCAERLRARDEADNSSLASVMREPGAFLRAYDLLLGAGWDPARDGAPYGRELAREMQRELEKHRIATQAGLHRQLWREATASARPLLANLLVIGFNAAHWPLWDLLKAATLSADQVVMALAHPRHFGEEPDQLWQNSWEEFTGTVVEVPAESTPDEKATPFAALAKSYETGSREDASAADLTFCVAPNLAAQARAVVLQALDYLQRENCTRLGIVFPQANALALNVAEELRRLNVPMNDGPGVLTPGTFERRSWETWLELQEEPGVPRLIAWVRACEAEKRRFRAEPGLRAQEVANLASGALAETLVDDLGFLARHIESKPDRRAAGDAVAEFLHGRVALPTEATFARFWKMTREVLDSLGWEDFRAEMKEPPAWLRKNGTVLARRAFLEWLREATDSQSRVRGRDGNHFYGRVHLLVFGQLAGQSWSHLILTGLNEGVWPRAFEIGAFGSRHELIALNQQARSLNRRVRTEGSQGEGQEIVREGFGYCLLPLERQDLALRDLGAALEATSEAVCLMAMPADTGRTLVPSDFLSHAYQAKTGRVLDEQTFRQLANATEIWCRQHEALFLSDAAAPAVSIEATWTAYRVRRDASQPFGPYEFAYAQPPERPIQLWCKQWETAWNHPATVWLESVVGAQEWPEGTLSWSGAIGTWAHQWMAQAMREGRERSSPALLPLIGESADRASRRIHEQVTASGIELYPWWQQVWRQARTIAVALGEILEPFVFDRPYAEEFRLPAGIVTALPGSDQADFELKGRLDLVLFAPGTTLPDLSLRDLSGVPAWVIDFKTGSARVLTGKEVAKGRGLQSLLYALAMRRLQAGPTAISLLVRNAPLKEQVQLDDALQDEALFRSLEILHRRGVFGMKADADNEYGYAPSYPLATQFIPGHILEAKWALVHGGEPGEGEGEE